MIVVDADRLHIHKWQLEFRRFRLIDLPTFLRLPARFSNDKPFTKVHPQPIRGAGAAQRRSQCRGTQPFCGVTGLSAPQITTSFITSFC